MKPYQQTITEKIKQANLSKILKITKYTTRWSRLTLVFLKLYAYHRKGTIMYMENDVGIIVIKGRKMRQKNLIMFSIK